MALLPPQTPPPTRHPQKGELRNGISRHRGLLSRPSTKQTESMQGPSDFHDRRKCKGGAHTTHFRGGINKEIMT